MSSCVQNCLNDIGLDLGGLRTSVINYLHGWHAKVDKGFGVSYLNMTS